MTEHDPIEAILKATGRRPPVAAERAERVRSAARSQWMRELTRRTRRRRAMWIATLAAVAVIAIAGLALRGPAAPIGPESAIRVARVANDVRMRTGSIPLLRSTETLRTDSSVPAGASLMTGGDGRAALRVAGGRSIRMDGGTTLRVLSDRTFVLVTGSVYVDSGTGAADELAGFRLDTPFGPVEDTGTQFEARVHEGTLLLRAREGSVRLRGAAGALTVSAGERLELGPGGRVDRSSEATTSPAWGWAEAIAPLMTIEGRSLREFLDWLARERGGHVQFDDPALAIRATEIVLRGTIDGMSLDEALLSVSATSALSTRWEGDVLVVRTSNPLR